MSKPNVTVNYNEISKKSEPLYPGSDLVAGFVGIPFMAIVFISELFSGYPLW